MILFVLSSYWGILKICLTLEVKINKLVFAIHLCLAFISWVVIKNRIVFWLSLIQFFVLRLFWHFWVRGNHFRKNCHFVLGCKKDTWFYCWPFLLLCLKNISAYFLHVEVYLYGSTRLSVRLLRNESMIRNISTKNTWLHRSFNDQNVYIMHMVKVFNI